MPDRDLKPPAPVKLGEPEARSLVAAAPPVEEQGGYILSPFVGTCYLEARPGEPPLVRVGDVVNAGTTVCIIEAMKLFNEIDAEQDCVIAEILVTDGQPVEFGTKLFRVRLL